MKTPSLFLSCLASLAIAHAEPAPFEKASTEMATAAGAFVDSLDDAQREKALIPFDSEERENWHFIPKARQGIGFYDLDASQRSSFRRLLRTGMSESGNDQVETIIVLERLLGIIENNPTYRDPDKYYVSIFGKPDPAGTWGWRFEGHHLSLNFTLVGGKAISATPSFFGANPAEVHEGQLKGTRPLHLEEDLARLLATSLHDSGKAVVFDEQPPREILTLADRIPRELDAVGVRVPEMTDSQKEQLVALMEGYARRHRGEIAAKDMEKIKAGLDQLRFGWAGGLEPGKRYYYRIQSDSLLIEAVNTQNNANHIHTVWRDLKGDFGRDFLSNQQ